MKKKNLTISDHAALRFIQRKYGIHVDGLKEHILSLIPGDIIPASGNIRINKGPLTYIIENHVLVTVLTRENK